ncbi:MAG: nucleotidyltransferase family protein [Leptospiraceae bacterium]|nr:nucleotidyltransferase family protein [Leptospiraceae bacterium]MCK6382679.1 nucleotidyltransferase family protein [Leptospiraceae bacterium]NUM42947.1 nucleotidyltransferase family protein [Leptospiraceae bacterium]
MTPDKNKILLTIRKNIIELSKKYSVTRIGIFGSIARDQATSKSDIDIVVEMEPDLFKRASLKYELENLLGTNVDVIRYSNRMNPHLKKRIDLEALYV